MLKQHSAPEKPVTLLGVKQGYLIKPCFKALLPTELLWVIVLILQNFKLYNLCKPLYIIKSWTFSSFLSLYTEKNEI